MLFPCVFWPRQVYKTPRTHLSLLSVLQLSLLQSTLGTKNKKVSVLEEGLWLFWPLKATLGISSRFSACTEFWERMCVKVRCVCEVWCVMMTEQALTVSPLMEMLGMFSAMAKQYVSNLGLPQCYEKGGGERIWVEKGFRGDRRGGGGGLLREITFLLTIVLWKWKIPAVM